MPPRPYLLEAFVPYRNLHPGDILAGDALILAVRPSASGKTVTLTVRTFRGEKRQWPRIKAADRVLVYSRGNPVEPGAPLLLPPDGNTAKAEARRQQQ
jgi:hypothetical protein